MTRSLDKAAMIRKAIPFVFGEGQKDDILRGPDAGVLKFFIANEGVLARPVQTVLEEEYHIRGESADVPQSVQRWYMRLESVIESGNKRTESTGRRSSRSVEY